MNAGACPAASACGNANTNSNTTASTQPAAAENGQSSDFSKVMDKAKTAPKANDKAVSKATDGAKQADGKTAAAPDKAAGTSEKAAGTSDKAANAAGKAAKKSHGTDTVTAAAGGSGNPLPPWLAAQPVPVPHTTVAKTTPAGSADATKLPDAAAVVAGITRGVAATLVDGNARGVAKVTTGKGAAAAGTTAAGADNGQIDTLLGGATAGSSPLLVLAKPGDTASAAAANGTPGHSGEFFNALNSMLTSTDGSANSAPAVRTDLASAHVAGQTQAATSGGANNVGNAGNAVAAGGSIPVPVHSPQWHDAFAARVVWQAGQDLQQAHLHLNPPHLGPVDVKLDVSADKVNAQFVTHHLETQQAIQDAIPRLREMMSQSGMSLMNANVFQQGHNGQPASYAPASGSVGAAPEEFENGSTLSASAPVRVGLVDAYA